MESDEYLFVYGLLRRDFHNSMAVLLSSKAAWLGRGFVYGEMFDIGDYPGVILNKTGTPVYGDVYLINDNEILNDLDEFEGIGLSFTKPYEYLRKKTKTFIKNEAQDCWVYEYQWPLENKIKIASGDYTTYLKGI